MNWSAIILKSIKHSMSGMEALIDDLEVKE